jgi:hypothetical protein
VSEGRGRAVQTLRRERDAARLRQGQGLARDGHEPIPPRPSDTRASTTGTDGT